VARVAEAREVEAAEVEEMEVVVPVAVAMVVADGAVVGLAEAA
jgi:hypothetical protein